MLTHLLSRNDPSRVQSPGDVQLHFRRRSLFQKPHGRKSGVIILPFPPASPLIITLHQDGLIVKPGAPKPQPHQGAVAVQQQKLVPALGSNKAPIQVPFLIQDLRRRLDEVHPLRPAEKSAFRERWELVFPGNEKQGQEDKEEIPDHFLSSAQLWQSHSFTSQSRRKENPAPVLHVTSSHWGIVSNQWTSSHTSRVKGVALPA